MGSPVDPELLDAAVAMARRAGELTLQYFRTSDLHIDRKGDGTPVTAADRGAERQLREEIGAAFPDDGIFGEEEAETPGTSGRRWIIDPIDGTKAFSNGVPAHVSDRAELSGSYVSTSSFSPWTEEQFLAARAARTNLRTWGDGY